MSTLYYTIDKETQTIDDIEECTGLKTITIYQITLDKPKVWAIIETSDPADSETTIKEWLEENGYEDRNYKLVIL